MTTGLSALPALCLAQLQCTPPPRAPPPLAGRGCGWSGFVVCSSFGLLLVLVWFWSALVLLTWSSSDSLCPCLTV